MRIASCSDVDTVLQLSRQVFQPFALLVGFLGAKQVEEDFFGYAWLSIVVYSLVDSFFGGIAGYVGYTDQVTIF